jgi:Nucleotidyl transferase of unknown function (DUF2204)
VAKKKTAPELPTAPLRDLLAWWKAAKVSGAIIGGLAVALYTKPRATRDVDAVIDIELSSLDSFLKRGEARGFRSRIPDPIPFAAQSRMVIVTHEESGIDVDMAIAGIPYETDAIARARPYKLGRLNVPLLTPEDLVVFKILAYRPVDKADVAHLFEFLPDLDVAFIRRHVEGFAEMLEEPELARELDRYRSPPSDK